VILPVSKHLGYPDLLFLGGIFSPFKLFGFLIFTLNLRIYLFYFDRLFSNR
jgi:hypothetical protein